MIQKISSAQPSFTKIPSFFSAWMRQSETQGIGYRFANQTDLPSILECANAAEEGFSKYYEESESYEPDSTDKVLIALDGDKVVGTLMVEEAPFMTKRVYIP